MELRKCDQCGGTLKRLRIRKMWVCPYCDAVYEDEKKEPEKSKYKTFGLNEEVFQVEKDLSPLMKNAGSAGVIKSIADCMKRFETAEEVEDYLMKLNLSDDISVKGVRENEIEKVLPRISEFMDPRERVILYGNKGIFSKGKEFYAITDRRSFVADKKTVLSVPHTELDSLSIASGGNCKLNNDYNKIIISLDATGTVQGALLAMICMLSFEQAPERDRIRIL